MQVIEHQFLHYRNVLSYITQIDDDDISFFVVGVKNNICVLDLKLNGKIKNLQAISITNSNRSLN